MTLPIYTPKQRVQMAERLNTNAQYLYQILTSRRIASTVLAKKINTAFPACSLIDLRPTDWAGIWPELAKTKKAKF